MCIKFNVALKKEKSNVILSEINIFQTILSQKSNGREEVILITWLIISNICRYTNSPTSNIMVRI